MTASLLQPCEGITGTDRAGDPVLSQQIDPMVADLLYQLYLASLLAGSPKGAPVGKRLWDRMTTPKPEDLVYVTDAQGHKDKLPFAFGYLITVRREWWTDDQEWEQERKGNPHAERMVEPRAWYIQYGPGRTEFARWTNCTVIAVPAVSDWWSTR